MTVLWGIITISDTLPPQYFYGIVLLNEMRCRLQSCSLAATANVGAAVEFPAYPLNLYDIDVAENSISFVVVAQEDDATLN